MDQRERFEANYVIDLNKATGKDYTAEQMKDLRDGDGYGEDRHYLNGRWDGWQAAEPQWQPIETAPKDRVVQLWVPTLGPWIEGPWRGAWSYVASQWVLHSPFTATDGRAITVSEIPHPTHWMPLPAAPVERGGE